MPRPIGNRPPNLFENRTPSSFRPGGMINTTPANMPPNPHQAPARADFRVLTPGDFRDGRTPPTPPPPLPPLLSPLNTSVGGMSPLSLRSGYQPSAHSSDLITSPGSTLERQSFGGSSLPSAATTRPPTPGVTYPGGTPSSSEGPHSPLNYSTANPRVYDSDYRTPLHTDPMQGFESPVVLQTPRPLDRNDFPAGMTPTPLRVSRPPSLFAASSSPENEGSQRSGSRTPTQAATPSWYAPTPGAAEYSSSTPRAWLPPSEHPSPRSDSMPSVAPTPGYGYVTTPGGYVTTPAARSPTPGSPGVSQQE